jgi:hypothetical protein
MFFKNIAYFVMALFVSPCIGTELTVAAPLPVIATTCEVTDVTSTSAVLNGKVNSYMGTVSATVWFRYGTVRDDYTGTSTSMTQNMTGGGDASTVSIGINGLSPGTTHYYRIVVDYEFSSESSGREKSFTTLSLTPTVMATPSPTSECNCTIPGRVIDAMTKKGIINASIRVDGSATEVYTDADGYYSWDDEYESRLGLSCCGGAYTLIASADGYKSLTQLIDIEPCISRTLDFELRPITSPTPTPTPTLTTTPTPECKAVFMTMSPKRLILQRGQSDEAIVTLEGDNCVPEGNTVIATIGKAGKRRISISSASEVTDANGQAKFTITAKNKIGNAKVTFNADSLKKTLIVKVK